MESLSVPWLAIRGFGSHIKANRSELLVQDSRGISRYPLAEIKHLLIIGGHHLHTSVVNSLMKAGSSITFCDADGRPTGMLSPSGTRTDEKIRSIQQSTPARKYAVMIATRTLEIQLLQAVKLEGELERKILYEGESSFLEGAIRELDFLVKMDEVRRIFKLGSDMYYEIMGRTLPPDLGFRRRTQRPHDDPVNTMLSLSYAVLYSIIGVSVLGSHLDPDIGMLHEGTGSLVYDLMEPVKPRLVDPIVFSLARADIPPSLFECIDRRCYLADELTGSLIGRLSQAINPKEMDGYVKSFCDSLTTTKPFKIPY